MDKILNLGKYIFPLSFCFTQAYILVNQKLGHHLCQTTFHFHPFGTTSHWFAFYFS
ncbi:hypothetical protein [Chryseobacterium salviniae]|uniref:Uncharacterized protein n=1 Tax=Chryseobacterium salviniae TaxID=3101750 RepID=A0ABU6HMD4_9FLAO|nr:hypothetical protein [Chryseobacterium sp. T9W2-O]MEC3874179.1 hypothetical protein [Chryseobacterium sp. T9W2-O]